ncbi:uncharacterized protein LOC114939007 [Nylanderia fulva]|uniref:uncharacterized protein LOC114939007 n=1 Tax=Nylanderia fulva TaxID=613905 RepID=UPI0010FB340A|nr:uncharacterized protein LOC114939007 [Nylanderia fulva]XP_029169052.1 uncharacterized protein LOC114939007 [Nylanderia fulva]
MKLREFLIVTWYLILVTRSETVKNDRESLLRKAAEQLERLAPYRREIVADNQGEVDLSNSPEIWRFPEDQNRLDEIKSDADQRGSPWLVISDILSAEQDATKKTDDEKLVTIDVIADPKYNAMMQERIKRGFDIGSAGLLTSIAGGLLSGVASASSSSAGKAIAGSSQSAFSAPVYGAPAVEHTYSYVEKPFGPWDFKKAIFGTLFQALKAIGGGVLALKGQLVKGGGYLLAGKSKVVTKAGDVITSFGKSLAASALVEPKPYPPETYYDHPPVPNIGHDANYPGSTNSDDYSETHNDYSSHHIYGVPSDDTSQGGLLIVTPTKSDLDDHNDQRTNVVTQEKPDLSKLEESFGGPAKGSAVTNLLNSVPKGSVGLKDETVDQDNSKVNPYPPVQHPASTYGTPNYGNTVQNYASGQEHTQQQPQLSSHHHFPYLDDPNLSNQQNVVYPPLQYPASPSASYDSSKLPYNDDGETSVYASLSIDTEPQISPLKVSLLPSALELPKLQPPVDFHGPQFANHLHGSLGGPLRVPLLNPMPSAYHWQSQGSLIPTLKTLNHKRNVLQRRAFAKRLALYSMLQKMRFY